MIILSIAWNFIFVMQSIAYNYFDKYNEIHINYLIFFYFDNKSINKQHRDTHLRGNTFEGLISN